MKAARLLSIYTLLIALVSCNPAPEEDKKIKDSLDDSFVTKQGGEVEPPAPSCYKDLYEAPEQSITRKLDILIVPDTSASIKEERKRIAEGFDYFVSALPEGVDFNIGVILGHSGKSNKSGKLYKKNSKDPLVLKSTELTLKEIQDSLSLKIHNPKTDGSSDGGEMGMYSILEALKEGNLQEIKSQGLLRDDAALAVIFVADEQDICAQAPQGITLKVDPQNGERKSFVKYCIEENIKWKDVNIGGSEYSYKITPQTVLDRLREVKGDMPLVVGGVLYDEASEIPTGNEDEIGYGYLETVRLAKGINVDLGSGDYRDGLKNLGKLATTSFSAPQSFDLSITPDEGSIKAFVDDILVGHTYDSLANKVFLVEDRDDLSVARIEYCEKVDINTPPVLSISATPLEGIVPLNVSIDGSASTDDKGIESFMLEVNGEIFTNTTGLFSYTFLGTGDYEALFKAIDDEGAISSQTITFKVNPAPIAPIADFTLSETAGRVPFSTVLNASSSTDADSTIISYDLSVNGVVTSQTSPVFNLSFNEAGNVSLILTVTDSQGLTSEKTGSLEVLPAFIAPIATISVTPESGRVPLDVVVDASGSSDSDGAIVKYDLTVNGNLISQTTPQFTFNVSEANTYNLSLVVTDNDGLTNSFEKSVSYLPALIAPVASLTATPNEAEVPFEITLDASGSTDVDGSIVNYIFSDGTNVVESPSSTLTFVQEVPGTYNYTVEVVDNDGLKSTANTQVIAKPKTTEEESALLSFYKFNLIPSGEAFELELIFEGRSLNGKAITEAYYSTPDGTRLDVGRRVLGHKDVIPFESDSSVDIKLTIVDELGGSSEYTQTVHSDPALQKPSLSINSIEFGPGELVFFSNQLFDPYNQLEGFASFRLDFGDGQIQEIFESSFQVNHQYAVAGPYSVTLTAVGGNSQEFSSTETVEVLGSPAGFEFPIADFRVETESWAPGVRLYVDQSLSPIAPIKTYLWNLGDGTTAYGPEVIHFYQAGGYDVTLTAILEDGSQSVVKREVIIMNDAPNIIANIDCADIGNLTLECEVIAVDKFSDLSNINIHFGDSEILPENIVSQSVSGQLAEVVFTHPYDASGNYSVTYQVQTTRGEELVKDGDFSVTDAPGNLPPVASLNCHTVYKEVFCDAYASFDPDGLITSYKFSMGNGEVYDGTNPEIAYSYSELGTYIVSLEVTDNFGTTSSTSTEVVIEEKPNEFPVPQLVCVSNSPHRLSCDGRNSYDPDGTIINGRMTSIETGETFETNSASDLVHEFTFETGGEKLIKFEVLDDRGALVEGDYTHHVFENSPPTALINCNSPDFKTLVCDSIGSSDFDGEITSSSWIINGESYTGETILITDLTKDQEVVQLTVTDNLGFKSSTSGIFQVKQNKTPKGDFTCDTSLPNKISCSAEFTDPENQLLDYEWQFLGLSFNNKNFEYDFINLSGEFPITLKVKDTLGGTVTITKPVFLTKNSPPVAAISVDRNGKIAPAVYNLSAEGSLDPEGQELTYEWSLPSGDKVSTPTLDYSQSTSGRTTISLKVTDEFGLSSTASLNLTTVSPISPSITYSDLSAPLPTTINISTSTLKNEFDESFSFEWLINGNLESENKSFDFFVESSRYLNIVLKITDDYGNEFVAQKTAEMSLPSLFFETNNKAIGFVNDNIEISFSNINFFEEEEYSVQIENQSSQLTINKALKNKLVIHSSTPISTEIFITKATPEDQFTVKVPIQILAPIVENLENTTDQNIQIKGGDVFKLSSPLGSDLSLKWGENLDGEILLEISSYSSIPSKLHLSSFNFNYDFIVLNENTKFRNGTTRNRDFQYKEKLYGDLIFCPVSAFRDTLDISLRILVREKKYIGLTNPNRAYIGAQEFYIPEEYLEEFTTNENGVLLIKESLKDRTGLGKLFESGEHSFSPIVLASSTFPGMLGNNGFVNQKVPRIILNTDLLSPDISSIYTILHEENHVKMYSSCTRRLKANLLEKLSPLTGNLVIEGQSETYAFSNIKDFVSIFPVSDQNPFREIAGNSNYSEDIKDMKNGYSINDPYRNELFLYSSGKSFDEQFDFLINNGFLDFSDLFNNSSYSSNVLSLLQSHVNGDYNQLGFKLDHSSLGLGSQSFGAFGFGYVRIDYQTALENYHVISGDSKFLRIKVLENPESFKLSPQVSYSDLETNSFYIDLPVDLAGPKDHFIFVVNQTNKISTIDFKIGKYCLKEEFQSYDETARKCGNKPIPNTSAGPNGITFSTTETDFVSSCQEWHRKVKNNEPHDPAWSGSASATFHYYCGESSRSASIKTADYVCKIGTQEDPYEPGSQVVDWSPTDVKSIEVSCDGLNKVNISF